MKENYPSANYLNTNAKPSNFITVGASGDPRLKGNNIIADFSNYGKESVDVFAPGVKIYSTLPGKNEYGNLQGTSMAAPIVSGLAALIRSYFPDLSAQQVKEAIEKSVYTPDSSVRVAIPLSNSARSIPFSSLCRSGGIVDAYAAVKLASTMIPANALKQNDRSPRPTFKNTKAN